jgi:hypothetical protein
VRLPDVEATVFERYVDWAYGNILVCGKETGTLRMLVQLYLLGDKLDDVKLRNKAIKALTNYCVVDKISPCTNIVKLIWNNTTPGSLLRKWVIDDLLMTGSRTSFQKNLPEHPSELIQQMASRLM